MIENTIVNVIPRVSFVIFYGSLSLSVDESIYHRNVIHVMGDETIHCGKINEM